MNEEFLKSKFRYLRTDPSIDFDELHIRLNALQISSKPDKEHGLLTELLPTYEELEEDAQVCYREAKNLEPSLYYSYIEWLASVCSLPINKGGSFHLAMDLIREAALTHDCGYQVDASVPFDTPFPDYLAVDRNDNTVLVIICTRDDQTAGLHAAFAYGLLQLMGAHECKYGAIISPSKCDWVYHPREDGLYHERFNLQIGEDVQDLIAAMDDVRSVFDEENYAGEEGSDDSVAVMFPDDDDDSDDDESSMDELSDEGDYEVVRVEDLE